MKSWAWRKLRRGWCRQPVAPRFLWLCDGALRAVHPNILGELSFKLCMRGVWEKSSQMAGNCWKWLESLTFNGQKWTKHMANGYSSSINGQFYGHESSISMGQNFWWFHPSISRRDSKRWLPSWHCIAAWVCQWGDFTQWPSGKQGNYDDIFTHWMWGYHVFRAVQGQTCLTRFDATDLFCWRTWGGHYMMIPFHGFVGFRWTSCFGCFDIEECPSWTCTARRQGSLGMGTFCWWIQGLLHVTPTKKWQIKYDNQSRLQ